MAQQTAMPPWFHLSLFNVPFTAAISCDLIRINRQTLFVVEILVNSCSFEDC